MRRFGGWRLRTDHSTTFEYSSPARASYNEVRQSPLTTAHQTVLDSRIHTSPNASQYAYWDYWGTQVVAFNVDAAHDQLVVHSSALVETQTPGPPPRVEWDEMGNVWERYAEFLAPSRYTEPSGPIVDTARALRTTSPLATVEAVVHWVHDSMEYVRGVTGVHTSAGEAYTAASGVCQDFAHLALAVLRTCGIPARYVSGYLHPDPGAEIGTEAAGESHAWIEAWAGDWWGLDPTNEVDIGLRHVVVARGRDYADVAPVKGIYAGNATHDTSVSVKITRTM